MFETDIHLRLLLKSPLDMYKVFEPLICYHKGIWVHTYAITLTKLAPDLGIMGHLWSEIDAMTYLLRLIYILDCFIHSYMTCQKCWSYWYAISRACGCTPLYHYTGQVGPRLGNSGSFVD